MTIQRQIFLAKSCLFLPHRWGWPIRAAMPDTAHNRPELPPEIARRRTFAIISHPDAGKTTLTEKFLLFGGAIQMAGQVRAKGEARGTRADFMQME
mgnify:CR=1 FL=1